MARQLCIEFNNAFYHVFSRGLNRQFLFLDDDDFKLFLYLCNEAKKKFDLLFLSYCLMNNHYHLFIQTKKPNLSKTMKFINENYARYFLTKYKDKDGHVFKGRYKRKVVQQELYALQLSRYIHLNPVKAGLVNKAEDWQWSSFRYLLNYDKYNALLNKDWLLSQFSNNKSKAQELLYNYTYEEDFEGFCLSKNSIANTFLSSQGFKEMVIEKFTNKEDLKKNDISFKKHLITKNNISKERIINSVDNIETNSKEKLKLKIFLLKEKANLSLEEIGALLNIKAKTISCIAIRFKQKIKNCKNTLKLIKETGFY